MMHALAPILRTLAPGGDYPPVEDVLAGVTYANGTMTGTLVVPLVGVNAVSGVLPLSPADVLRRALILLGYGSDPVQSGAQPAWPIYTSVEPTSPDNVITTFDTSGRVGSREWIAFSRWDDAGFQVRVRAATHTVGWAKLSAISEALDRELNDFQFTIGTTQFYIRTVIRVGTPVDLGAESPTSKRRVFTLNGLISVVVVPDA